MAKFECVSFFPHHTLKGNCMYFWAFALSLMWVGGQNDINNRKCYPDTYIQLASSVPGRFAFYEVFSGNFDRPQMPLKVLKTSFSLLILINIDQIFQKKLFLAP